MELCSSQSAAFQKAVGKRLHKANQIWSRLRISWNCYPFKRPSRKGCTKQTKCSLRISWNCYPFKREKAAQSKQNVRYALTVFLSIAFKREKAAQSKQNVRYVCHGTVFLSIGRLSNGRGKKAAQSKQNIRYVMDEIHFFFIYSHGNDGGRRGGGRVWGGG